MIQKNEVLLKSNDEWLHFTNPQRVLCVERLDEVHGALEEVEQLVEQNHWHAAGFVSYEAAPVFDSALHVLSDGSFPLLWFGLYPEPQALQTSEILRDYGSLRALDWQPSVERESYNTAIEKVKEYIARGRTYQVNYTMRLNAEFNGGEWEFFQRLAQSQNKYAAYIDTGRFVVCSASPELFFHLNRNRIYSRPMKGTVKRGRISAEDRVQAEWLKASLKNRAENVMIVDMVRNDLGRIAQTGSVHVPDLFSIEKYPTLFQMTSTVQAKTDASLTEIFSALFPCASITGAPKVSTMNIIAELESTPRKLYTGSIGYILPNRKAQFNVAIRTAIIDRETHSAEYGLGGGIVWDSTSADEYSEALLKARVLTESPRQFDLLETLLWTPDEGFSRSLREKHLARMQDSADYFGFPFSAEKFDACLNQLEAGFTSPQRVRILLGRSGQFQSEAKDFQSQEKVFKVRLAENPINAKDVFLFHKTTQREMYPPIPADCDDLLLWNENDELTEFTIGNLVVELDGSLFTPPISCGLLAGTFRSYLLETGQVRERVILKDELAKCAKVFLVNSVRKWVRVEFHSVEG